MNILFVLYGSLAVNSVHPLAMHFRGLRAAGHDCAVAVGSTSGAELPGEPLPRAVLYEDALAHPEEMFEDGRGADVVHAWTPREGVRRFVTGYLARHQAPLVMYLEDNEGWLARSSLALIGIHESVLHRHSEDTLSYWTPPGMPHVLRYRQFVELADAAVVIQDRLAMEVPPWVPCRTVMPGVDLELFAPREPNAALRRSHGVSDRERMIVYPGGLNDFTRSPMESLCEAVGVVNRRGVPCRLLRTGYNPIDFRDRLTPEANAALTDLGELPRRALAELLSSADVLVQPGTPNAFEDLRLPGKLPELLASGRPVVLPNVNIASLLQDGVEALVHHSGGPAEIAEKCLALFSDPEAGRRIGVAGRLFAEEHFSPGKQAARLEEAYRDACKSFDRELSRDTWCEGKATTGETLARRLRSIAGKRSEGAPMLLRYAQLLEASRERELGLEAAMAHRDSEIAARDAQIGTLERGAALSSRGNVERDGRIAALEASRSWRFTRPFRIAYGLMRRVLFDIPPDRHELALRPLDRDPELLGEANGVAQWRAATADPQFVAGLSPGASSVAPGWLEVKVELVPKRGHLAGPRIYIPRATGGHTEFHSVELKFVDGAYRAHIFLPRPVREFRFDPSIYPCDFDCHPLRLTPALGAGHWIRAAAGLLRVATQLNRGQLWFCLRQGFEILLMGGPQALMDAAFWAFANHARAPQPGYPAWVRAYATLSAADLAEMAAESRRLHRQPLISFVTPTYNTPAPYLRAMLESVLRQAYPHWELCLADDASTAAHVRPILEEYAARDPRIKIAWRDTNGHISAASNTAIGLATGEYLALLDHDDELTPDALFWVAKELDEHPDAALVYSDEDKLNFDGSRTVPYFKSDWNYDLFLSHNLITHLGVYRADIVREVGGFREEFTGSQDYDLALRFIERIKPTQIRHIPRVLYHWRMLRGSTALGSGEKHYAAERSRSAIAEHLARKGIAATVEFLPEMAAHRVRYHVPRPAALASIIIPTRNAARLVRNCIDSIVEKTTYSPYEILLVDNGSDDPEALAYFRSLQDRGTVRLLHDPLPFNYSRINNDAARHARGEYLVLLNNDTVVIAPEWLTELVSHAQRPEVGAVGAKLWYPDDTIQHAGVVLTSGAADYAHARKPRGDHGYFGRANLIQELSALTSACLCVRKEVFERSGGLDESLPVAFNDIDFCLSLQAAGYRNIYTPYAELYHHESATRGFEDTPEKMQRFQREVDLLRRRWMPILMNDPHYNPNLALTGETFSLAGPPRVAPFRATVRAANPNNSVGHHNLRRR